jgi:hypothetical protein
MRSFLLVFILCFGAGCADDGLRNTRNFIYAGVTNDEVIKYIDFTPDEEVELKNVTVGGFPTQYSEGILSLKFSINRVEEITFKSFTGSTCPIGAPCFTPVNGCEIKATKTSIEFCPEALSYNEVINNDLNWLPIEPRSNFLSASTSYLNREPHNNWESGDNKFLGIRFIYENDTVYGWVGLHIEDYYKLTLRDFAVNKR